MMSNQVKITGSRHAYAVVQYFVQSALGLAYIVDLAQAKTMTDIGGPVLVSAWALILFFGGGVAASAALLGANHMYTRPALLLEQVTLSIVGAASLWYEVTVAIGNGLTVMTTQIQAVGVFAACVARVVQLHRERRKINAAEVAQSTAAMSVDER